MSIADMTPSPFPLEVCAGPIWHPEHGHIKYGFSQQSVLLDENSERSQLFLPHTRLPEHSESLSQSPWPSPQGCLVSQHSCTCECDPEAHRSFPAKNEKIVWEIPNSVKVQKVNFSVVVSLFHLHTLCHFKMWHSCGNYNRHSLHLNLDHCNCFYND